jgi:anti-sigma-K factor RskA
MMDKEKFLASGLLEQYVLRLTTPEEDQEVERFANAFPEIAKEIEEMRFSLEQYAQQYAVPPPPKVKKSILEQIDALETANNGVPSSATKSSLGVFSRWASVLLLGVYVIFGVIMTLRYQSIKKENLQLLKNLEHCESDSKNSNRKLDIIALIEDRKTQPVYLKGSALSPASQAIVYWNPQSKLAYLNPYALSAPPKGKQYQIWADVDGKMISLGLIDLKVVDFQKINHIDRAVSLNITIEPLGGSKSPNVSQLLANGLI